MTTPSGAVGYYDEPDEFGALPRPVMAEDRWSERPMFALDADVTVYWPDVRPCYDAAQSDRSGESS